MKWLPKNTVLLLAPLLFAVACSNEPKQTTVSKTSVTQTEEVKAMIPAQTCYVGIMGKDSIFLKTERFPNVVTGTLVYKFYEKDQSQGALDGKMHGDTLVADYTFSSEGKTSVRQVAFLLSADSAREGYGEQEEKEGKMVFKNLGELNFKDAVTLGKTACH